MSVEQEWKILQNTLTGSGCRVREAGGCRGGAVNTDATVSTLPVSPDGILM